MGVTVGNYPDGVNTAGPTIANLRVIPVKFEVDLFPNEDGGVDVNVQPCGNLRFELDYEGLSSSEFSTLINHWSTAKGEVNNFTFYCRRDAATYTGVRYETFEVPQWAKSWSQSLRVVLVKYA